MKTTAMVLLLMATAGWWPPERSKAILDKTQTIRLGPDLSALTPGEAEAVRKLLQVGAIFQDLYEVSRHHQARQVRSQLPGLKREDLAALYRLFQGPIATTLENKREPFAPVDPEVPGKNVYPWGATEKKIEDFLAAHPQSRDEILHPRSVVRANTLENRKRDLETLQRHPLIEGLHPGLRKRIETPGGELYAIPYSVAYADELVKAFNLLHEAADAVRKDDPDFAGYLRNRARDLLTDDYEAGDASWVTGDFKRLNAQLGSYETYDDELLGVKTFFSASVLLRNARESAELRRAISGLQEFENSLPYPKSPEPPPKPKKVREDIPVGVYDVIADYGQARSTNTATILPNESHLARKYGRIILLRANVMRHPDLFVRSSGTWTAAIQPEFSGDLTNEGNFYRTLWHEIGHYLGVDRDRQGREINQGLQENADAMEEMKADLVSLSMVPELRKRGYYTDQQARSVYASGILRVLQNVKPRREQPYQTMQLMQWNYFLENGLLSFDPSSKSLRIHYDKYHAVVNELLREVLAVQYGGDKEAADRFIERYSSWREDLHGVIAGKIRSQQKYRFTIVRYAAERD